MNISQWSASKILQLPEHVFGQKWLEGFSGLVFAAPGIWNISRSALPERCIIWALCLSATGGASESAYVEFALGDQLPATAGAFDALEKLFPGCSGAALDTGVIEVPTGVGITIPHMKYLISPMGRRFVMQSARGVATPDRVSVQMVISSVPTEVPDCLLSV